MSTMSPSRVRAVQSTTSRPKSHLRKENKFLRDWTGFAGTDPLKITVFMENFSGRKLRVEEVHHEDETGGSFGAMPVEAMTPAFICEAIRRTRNIDAIK
jgi:hypothetical protein